MAGIVECDSKHCWSEEEAKAMGKQSYCLLFATCETYKKYGRKQDDESEVGKLKRELAEANARLEASLKQEPRTVSTFEDMKHPKKAKVK